MATILKSTTYEHLTIAVEKKTDLIQQIWCKKPYRGKYKEILSPGMCVREILGCTVKQRVVCDFLCIGDDLLAGFSMPNKYEDVDSVSDLPLDLVLEEFHVMKKGWCVLSR